MWWSLSGSTELSAGLLTTTLLLLLATVTGSDFGLAPFLSFFGVSAGERVAEDAADDEHSRLNSAQATFLKFRNKIILINTN
jgi:hypothetical protein